MNGLLSRHKVVEAKYAGKIETHGQVEATINRASRVNISNLGCQTSVKHFRARTSIKEVVQKRSRCACVRKLRFPTISVMRHRLVGARLECHRDSLSSRQYSEAAAFIGQRLKFATGPPAQASPKPPTAFYAPRPLLDTSRRAASTSARLNGHLV